MALREADFEYIAFINSPPAPLLILREGSNFAINTKLFPSLFKEKG